MILYTLLCVLQHLLTLFLVVATSDIQVFGSGCTCIDVPEPERAPFLAIPRSPTSVEPDFLCIAVPHTYTVNQCNSLRNSCGENSADFIFFQSIRICSDSTGTQFKMCFTNVTAEMNNTTFHFYYSQSPRCAATGYKVQSKLYIASYKMITQGTTKLEYRNLIIIIIHVFRVCS